MSQIRWRAWSDLDLHVVDNGDGTLTIVVLATGPSTLYGPDGKAIARNPGQVRCEIVVNHGGTPSDPSDDVERASPRSGLDRTVRRLLPAIVDAIG